MAASDETNEFLSDEGGYNESFNYFTRGRREQEEVWIASDLVPRISELLKASGETLRVLAIGPGVGAFDILFLRELIKFTNDAQFACKMTKIIWTVVEPNVLATDEFQKVIEKNAADFAKVQFVWINKGFEEFVDSGTWDEDKDKYDLVHFVHCFYYMQEQVVAKKTMDKLLAPKGRVVVVVGKEGDVWTQLMKGYKDKVPTLASELHYLTSDQLCKQLEGNGWKFEMFIGKLDLEITEIFLDNHPAGIEILKFFLHTKEDARKSIKPEIIKEIVDFLKTISWVKTIEGKEHFFTDDDEGIVIISN